MGRADRLLEELNRGVNVEAKTNQVIDNWTPNNLKRLIIGINFAIVEYHCVPQNSKYTRLVNVIKFSSDVINEDIEKESKGKYSGVLTCLLENRVNSCIEEIVFCKDPRDIYEQDINLFISKNRGQLNTKFPRLRYVSVLNMTIPELAQGFNEEQKEHINALITDLYEDRVIDKVYIGPEDYKTKTYLRPQHYTLDSPDGLLHKRLKEVKQEYTEQQNRIEQRDIDLKAIKGLLRKHDEFLSMLNTIIALDKVVYRVLESNKDLTSPVARGMNIEFLQFDRHLEDSCKKTKLDLNTLDFNRAIKTLQRVCSECEVGESFDNTINDKLEDITWLNGYFNKLNESRDVDDFNNIQSFILFMKTIVITWYIASARALYDTLKYAITDESSCHDYYASYRGMYKKANGHTKFKFHTGILSGVFEEDAITDTKMSNAKEQFGIAYTLDDKIDIGNSTMCLLKTIALWFSDDTLYVSDEIMHLGEVK